MRHSHCRPGACRLHGMRMQCQTWSPEQCPQVCWAADLSCAAASADRGAGQHRSETALAPQAVNVLGSSAAVAGPAGQRRTGFSAFELSVLKLPSSADCLHPERSHQVRNIICGTAGMLQTTNNVTLSLPRKHHVLLDHQQTCTTKPTSGA